MFFLIDGSYSQMVKCEYKTRKKPEKYKGTNGEEEGRHCEGNSKIQMIGSGKWKSWEGIQTGEVGGRSVHKKCCFSIILVTVLFWLPHAEYVHSDMFIAKINSQ